VFIAQGMKRSGRRFNFTPFIRVKIECQDAPRIIVINFLATYSGYAAKMGENPRFRICARD